LVEASDMAEDWIFREGPVVIASAITRGPLRWVSKPVRDCALVKLEVELLSRYDFVVDREALVLHDSLGDFLMKDSWAGDDGYIAHGAIDNFELRPNQSTDTVADRSPRHLWYLLSWTDRIFA